jgi:hypothetical protein
MGLANLTHDTKGWKKNKKKEKRKNYAGSESHSPH